MNGKNKVIPILGVSLLSILLLAASPQPAMAKPQAPRKQPEARSRSQDHDRDRDPGRNRGGDRDRDGGRLQVGISLGGPLQHGGNSRWVPSHYETRTETVLVEPGHYERQTQRVLVEPGHYEVRRIPAVHNNRRGPRGQKHIIVVQPARTERVWIPPKYEERKVKVWVPDRYETRKVKVWVPGHWIASPARSPARFWLNLGRLFKF